MNTTLWIIQIILSIKLITAAYTHGFRQAQPTMQQAIQKMGKRAQPWLYWVAVGTFIGCLGLILPAALGMFTWITPLAAGIISLMLLFSTIFHIQSREVPNIFVSLILSALAAFVAYGRWVLVPL